VIFCLAMLIFTACGQPPVRILITTGGHDYEEGPFWAMFDEMEGITYEAISLPENADMLKPGLQKNYDVILMYDMVDSIEVEHQQAFVNLLNEGIGLVSMHHNLGAHRHWDEFTRIIGGKYVFEERVLEGSTYPPSTFHHDMEIPVTVVDKSHPVTRGLTDFTIHDETYKGYYKASDVRVLLTSDHSLSDPPLCWIQQYGKSPVCYILFGHDSKAWRHSAFSKLVRNAIIWAANGGNSRKILPDTE